MRALGLCPLLATVLLSTALPAAEVAGKWYGNMTADGRESVPVLLTIWEGPDLSGIVAIPFDATPAPLEKISLVGDRLTFQALDSMKHVVSFQLTVTVRDMKGEAVSEGKRFNVYLTPARQTNTYERQPPGSTFAPTLIYKAEPEYTEEARQAHLQGTVLISAKITPDGRATELKVLRSLGMGLDEKALECVAKWRFKPGFKNGQPVPVVAQIEVNFRL